MTAVRVAAGGPARAPDTVAATALFAGRPGAAWVQGLPALEAPRLAAPAGAGGGEAATAFVVGPVKLSPGLTSMLLVEFACTRLVRMESQGMLGIVIT